MRHLPLLSRFIGLLLLAVLLAPSVVERPSDVVAQSEADAAAEFAIKLSRFEHAGLYNHLYELMHPDAVAVIPRSAVVGWYREDFGRRKPQEITEIQAVRQVSWTWDVTGTTYGNAYEVDYIQPFGTDSAIEYVSDTVRLVPVGNSFGWFFGRSREFVDEQIERFAGQSETTEPFDTGNSQPRASLEQTGASECMLVELFPGYPGYRGNITGVMPHWNGLGDWECLETLEQQNPRFDRASEDQANQAAADALGIRDSMELWTWENWMQIEAERGMRPSCYSCLMLDPSTTPLRTDIAVDGSDYRIATGFIGSTTGIRSVLETIGLHSAGQTGSAERFFDSDDYVLRALAYLTGGPTMNAQELYREMQRLTADALSPGQRISDIVNSQQLLHVAIWQTGGYTYTFDESARDDQVFLMVYAFGAARIGMGAVAEETFMRNLDQSISGWRIDNPSVTLAEYMRQQPVWQDLR